MEPAVWLTRDALYDADFPWTVVDGRVYAIGDFIPRHPGGALIRRAVGEDASELFHTHHTGELAARVLARYEIGRLREACGTGAWSSGCGPFQRLLNARAAGLEKTPRRPVAEVVAFGMLALFFAWAYLCYGCGWWRLNVALAWFWQRHLDAGLHASAHGDFRLSRRIQATLAWIYGLLSHRASDYYVGSDVARGIGMSKHFWHHVHTNDPGRDPDWATMNDVAWVRRHSSAPWRPHHKWQCWYWLPVTTFVEPCLELLQVTKECIEALGALLEPPCQAAPFAERLRHLALTLAVVLLNPGYQGVAFFFQSIWRGLGTLLLSRAVARLVLFPFSEVQHYMPEHFVGEAAEADAETSSAGSSGLDEWAVAQLRRTANLRFGNPLARALDFLMFHGDSHQIEHHLWPAMSFVRYGQAARIVREACGEFGVPYHEVGYWEGYAKIWQQIRQRAKGKQAQRLQSPAPASPPAPVLDGHVDGSGQSAVAPPARGRGRQAKRRRVREGAEEPAVVRRRRKLTRAD